MKGVMLVSLICAVQPHWNNFLGQSLQWSEISKPRMEQRTMLIFESLRIVLGGELVEQGECATITLQEDLYQHRRK